jgi:hypothetical protein
MSLRWLRYGLDDAWVRFLLVAVMTQAGLGRGSDAQFGTGLLTCSDEVAE